MQKRILLTGAQGFVAGSVLRQRDDGQVYAVSRGKPLLWGRDIHWCQLNPCDSHALTALFEEVRPTAVIHTAALANIDYCQAHREEAHRVNTVLTQQIAQLSRRYGAKMVYCSTDNIYDGVKGLYSETDAAVPVNWYGETKLRAEDAVLNVAHGVVARVSLVMGVPMLGAGNSFLSWMMARFKAGEVVETPDNEIRTPIDVVTVARALLELAGNTYEGTLQLAGNNRINRYAMVCQIAEQLGYSHSLVRVNDPTEIPGRADRPLDASLDNTKARALLQTPMLGVAEGVDLVLRTKANLEKNLG